MVSQTLPGPPRGLTGFYSIAYSINAMSPITVVLRPAAAASAGWQARRLPFLLGTAMSQAVGFFGPLLQNLGDPAQRLESSSQIAVVMDETAQTLFIQPTDQTSNLEGAQRAESSTVDSRDPLKAERDLARLLELVTEHSKEGEWGLLDAALTAFVSSRGPAALVDIAVAADRGQLPELDLVQVMRTISDWREPEFVKIAGWLIRRFLTHTSAAIRAGALAALLQLEDASALPDLERARNGEQIPLLRRSMSRGMDYLRAINARTIA